MCSQSVLNPLRRGLSIAQVNDLLRRDALLPEEGNQFDIAPILLREGIEHVCVLKAKRSDDKHSGSLWLPITPARPKVWRGPDRAQQEHQHVRKYRAPDCPTAYLCHHLSPLYLAEDFQGSQAPRLRKVWFLPRSDDFRSEFLH